MHTLFNSHSQVVLWHGQLSSDSRRCDGYWELLSPDEQEKANKFINTQLGSKYIETRARVRTLLSSFLGIEAKKIKFSVYAYGKPYLADYPDIAFNLSHSGNMLAIAISNDCQLGVDIEIIKPQAVGAGLAKEFFAAKELAYWHSLGEKQKISVFYQYWTRKEAFVKAVGRGLSLDMSKVIISPNNSTIFSSVPSCGTDATDWKVADLNLGSDVSGALVVNSDSFELKIKRF